MKRSGAAGLLGKMLQEPHVQFWAQQQQHHTEGAGEQLKKGLVPAVRHQMPPPPL